MGEPVLELVEQRALPEAGTRLRAEQEQERARQRVRAPELAGEQRRLVAPGQPASSGRRISRPSHLAAATGIRRHSTRCMCSSFAGPNDCQVMRKRASAQNALGSSIGRPNAMR